MPMRGLRVLVAALLLVAFTVGVPTHHAAAHGAAHLHTARAAHVHLHSKPCPDCPAKPDPDWVCKIACAAALAVIGVAPVGTWSPHAYAIRFAAAPTRSPQGAAPSPDPFPPKRPRIA